MRAIIKETGEKKDVVAMTFPAVNSPMVERFQRDFLESCCGVEFRTIYDAESDSVIDSAVFVNDADYRRCCKLMTEINALFANQPKDRPPALIGPDGRKYELNFEW